MTLSPLRFMHIAFAGRTNVDAEQGGGALGGGQERRTRGGERGVVVVVGGGGGGGGGDWEGASRVMPGTEVSHDVRRGQQREGEARFDAPAGAASRVELSRFAYHPILRALVALNLVSAGLKKKGD
ncbi:hypothetical protein V1477_000394 [Vespula maculifrons]|uniref:Uncharacterized protein n=1 Tax=Vespula maculifrons TaxID=7453 RepID=A0ABD2D1J2_VESMC